MLFLFSTEADGTRGHSAEQVIIQVWITSLLGVIPERLLVADENILFIRGTFARRWGSVKGIRAIFSLLLPALLLRGSVKLLVFSQTEWRWMFVSQHLPSDTVPAPYHFRGTTTALTAR